MFLDFQLLCPFYNFFSRIFLYFFVPFYIPLQVIIHQSVGRRSERTHGQAEMAVLKTESSTYAPSLSSPSYLYCRAASTLIPLLPKAIFMPSIQPNKKNNNNFHEETLSVSPCIKFFPKFLILFPPFLNRIKLTHFQDTPYVHYLSSYCLFLRNYFCAVKLIHTVCREGQYNNIQHAEKGSTATYSMQRRAVQLHTACRVGQYNTATYSMQKRAVQHSYIQYAENGCATQLHTVCRDGLCNTAAYSMQRITSFI